MVIMISPQHQRAVSTVVDTISAGAIVGTLIGLLPAFAAIAGILWYAIQIWESKTVQKRVRVWKAKKRAARRAAIAFELGQLRSTADDAEDLAG